MVSDYISRMTAVAASQHKKMPWDITNNLSAIILQLIETCDNDYILNDGVAVHKTAVIEQNVVLKPPVLIGENVSIGANAYVRGPVLLDKGVHIGAGCEIKQSMIFADTAIAHFNYIGNSIIGSNVNFEAGSVAANHFNEREDRIISVIIDGRRVDTGVTKFGALVGDGCRIGANAVLSPGTILPKNYVVKRLELIEQK
jgi:UDP-N-acetylglucosamine diphosphorylase / glucose-1-phosphate thymidylyltransferase / UDP-N-acetylgalactosamine diphosphorylase / glucosamine-1-phosphate N-acetyltransferase / galactosamine-1-phosphate N-acetyltransferase